MPYVQVWKHLEELNVVPVYYTVPWLAQWRLYGPALCLADLRHPLRWLTLMLTQDLGFVSSLWADKRRVSVFWPA